MQQLVAGCTAAVCAQRDARSKAFQLECAVKRIIFLRHKNRRTNKFAVARQIVASETMQREENINLQQRENKFSLCNKSILSAIGNQRFPVYSLASSKLQVVEKNIQSIRLRRNKCIYGRIFYGRFCNCMEICCKIQNIGCNIGGFILK